MANLRKTIIAVVTLLAAVLLGGSENPHAQALPDKPVVLLAEVKAEKMVYQIDGRALGPDLLHALEILAERRGKDVKIIVLLDNHSTFLEYGNIEGLLGKAELTRFRFYIFNRQSNLMGTLEFGKTIPFTTSPPWE
jgi:hypothetical protein